MSHKYSDTVRASNNYVQFTINFLHTLTKVVYPYSDNFSLNAYNINAC